MQSSRYSLTDPGETLDFMSNPQQSMMALGNEGTRDSDAYLATVNAQGRVVRAFQAQDANLRAQQQRRQAQISSFGDEVVRGWNDTAHFEESEDVLPNIGDGQSHRAAAYQSSSTPRPAGAGTVPRTGPVTTPHGTAILRARGTVPINGGRNALAAPRANEYNPFDHPTVRFINGQRQELPPASRRRRPPRTGPVTSVRNSVSNNTSRALPAVNHGCSTQSPRTDPVATGSNTTNNTSRQEPIVNHGGSTEGPSTGPIANGGQVPDNTSHQQPAVNHGGRQSQSSREPTPQSAKGPSEQDMVEAAVDRILKAATHANAVDDDVAHEEFLFVMKHKPLDAPHVQESKVLTVDCALNSNKPSAIIMERGPKWVEIFHQTRRSLLFHALDIAYLDVAPQNQQLARAGGILTDFHKIWEDVRDALVRAKHINPVMRQEWADANKLDVLDAAVSNEKLALKSWEEQRQAAAASCAHEMDVDTSVEQREEFVDPNSTIPQFYGNTNTISGPNLQVPNLPNQPQDHPPTTPTPTPSLGIMRSLDPQLGSFLEFEEFVREEWKLLVGVDATVNLRFNEHLDRKDKIVVLAAFEEALREVSKLLNSDPPICASIPDAYPAPFHTPYYCDEFGVTR